MKGWGLFFGLTLLLANPGLAKDAALAEDALPRAEIVIGLQVIQAEVADTEARRQRGLSGREQLPQGHGMWFHYEEPSRPAFWMKGMHFPLDFIFVRNGVLVDFQKNVSHEHGMHIRVRPRVPATGVLEVPAGTIERWGWRVGDRVYVTLLPEKKDGA